MSPSFQPEEGLVVVPCRLWGPAGSITVRLALDTGATLSMVNWDIVISLGYDPLAATSQKRITTASGVAFVAQVAIQRLEALEQHREQFPVLCHTLPPSATVDGLLGLDFLQGQRLIVDFRALVVSLE